MLEQLHLPGIPARQASAWVTYGLAREDAAMMWLRLDVEMPTDDKLFGLPVPTRYLWVCLLALAKKLHWNDGDPTIRGHNAQTLAARFNLGKPKGVQDGLDALADALCINVTGAGAIIILNFAKHQGEHDPIAKRKQWADQKKKQRKTRPVSASMSATDNGESPHESPRPVHQMSSPLELEVEKKRDVTLSDCLEGQTQPSVDNSPPELPNSLSNSLNSLPVNNAAPEGEGEETHIGDSIQAAMEAAQRKAENKPESRTKAGEP